MQGAYGEGIGDVMSVLLLDSPLIALGLSGNCAQPLRNADNNCQYDAVNCSSCGSEIHSCGNLLSGCVWSTRNELAATEPSDYRDILSSLAIGSILMHTGGDISPNITVDWLVLDDDDDDLCNGSPHFDEIEAGFSAHGMFQEQLDFVYPQGLPQIVLPGGGTIVNVSVSCPSARPQPGTGLFHVNTGSGFTALPLTESQPGIYVATFPAADCLDEVQYYFSVETTTGQQVTSPPGAPAMAFTAIAAVSAETVFGDNFESSLDWTVTNSPGLTDGPWERGVPIPNCDRGSPDEDADGSGQCYLTDNSAATCDSDVDGGSTTLTSPSIDATGDTFISYWRWFSNTQGASPFQDIFEVQVSADGGTTWVALETVGPAGPEVDGGWFHKTFRVADFVTPTINFRVQFIASDTNPQSIVEAAVDGVELSAMLCQILGDLDGDGHVGTADMLALLAAWGACPGPCPPTCPADLDGDCSVGTADFLILLANWG